jgi:hypothetical protein
MIYNEYLKTFDAVYKDCPGIAGAKQPASGCFAPAIFKAYLGMSMK